MKNFGIVPVADNPATAQIIIPGIRGNVGLKPFGTEPVQLSLPFKENKRDSLCNDCEYLTRITRPCHSTCNCKCSAETNIVGGKIIKLKVYPEEKIEKPYWCPIIKNKILNAGKGSLFIPDNKTAMSDKQLESWEKSKREKEEKEKWQSLPGITSWADIKLGKRYHMPPMFKKGRMNLYIANKYCDSLMAYKNGTNERVWLYKQDEEYKFLSEIK